MLGEILHGSTVQHQWEVGGYIRSCPGLLLLLSLGSGRGSLLASYLLTYWRIEWENKGSGVDAYCSHGRWVPCRMLILELGNLFGMYPPGTGFLFIDISGSIQQSFPASFTGNSQFNLKCFFFFFSRQRWDEEIQEEKCEFWCLYLYDRCFLLWQPQRVSTLFYHGLIFPLSPKQATVCGYPISIFFIVVNEFCERFSYYGMRGELRCSGFDATFLLIHQLQAGALSFLPSCQSIFLLITSQIKFTLKKKEKKMKL